MSEVKARRATKPKQDNQESIDLMFVLARIDSLSMTIYVLFMVIILLIITVIVLMTRGGA